MTIKEKFYSKNPNATAYIAYNEKIKKYICYTYNVLQDSKQVIDKQKVQKIINQNGLDYLSAIVSYIEKTNINLYEFFSDFYAEVYSISPEKYSNLDSFCDAFNKYINKEIQTEDTSTTYKPTIYAYILNNDGEINCNAIFKMDLTIYDKNELKTCIIDNTFTEADYRGIGIHGLGIRFLEAVLAEKNIHTIQGKSVECDIYESSNNSTLEGHYKNLGFDIDYEEDGSYTINKCVNPYSTLDISKPQKIKTK